MEQGSIPGHNPAYHPSTYPLQIPHISLLYTVCDRKRWVSVEFTKSFPDVFNTTKGNIYAIWVDSQLSTNPSGKIPTTNPPPFSNICPRYARWGVPLIFSHHLPTWIPVIEFIFIFAHINDISVALFSTQAKPNQLRAMEDVSNTPNRPQKCKQPLCLYA